MMAGPWVLILYYFFMTVAELFISPLGLSFVSKVAPKHMQGLCQGLWLGATAVGNLLLLDRPTYLQRHTHMGGMGRIYGCLPRINGCNVRHGKMARTRHLGIIMTF